MTGFESASAPGGVPASGWPHATRYTAMSNAEMARVAARMTIWFLKGGRRRSPKVDILYPSSRANDNQQRTRADD
jgi:hypothetical protein